MNFIAKRMLWYRGRQGKMKNNSIPENYDIRFDEKFTLWLTFDEEEEYKWLNLYYGFRFFLIAHILNTIKRNELKTALIFDKDDIIPRQIQQNTDYAEWFTRYYPEAMRKMSYDFIYVGAEYSDIVNELVPFLSDEGIMMIDGIDVKDEVYDVAKSLTKKMNVHLDIYKPFGDEIFRIVVVKKN